MQNASLQELAPPGKINYPLRSRHVFQCLAIYQRHQHIHRLTLIFYEMVALWNVWGGFRLLYAALCKKLKTCTSSQNKIHNLCVLNLAQNRQHFFKILLKFNIRPAQQELSTDSKTVLVHAQLYHVMYCAQSSRVTKRLSEAINITI